MLINAFRIHRQMRVSILSALQKKRKKWITTVKLYMDQLKIPLETMQFRKITLQGAFTESLTSKKRTGTR